MRALGADATRSDGGAHVGRALLHDQVERAVLA